MKKLVPSAEIEFVPSVGHFTMIEATEVVEQQIQTLLEKLKRRLG